MKITVAEIHKAFKEELNNTLEELNVVTEEKADQNLIQKANRLQKLGFDNTKTSKRGVKEAKKHAQLAIEARKREDLRKAIQIYSSRYPLYRFITEEAVMKLCNKYNLVLGPAEYFNGDIPEKNLIEIEHFKIAKADLVDMRNGRLERRSSYSDEAPQFWMVANRKEFKKSSTYKLKKRKFVQIIQPTPPDPIVLCPVSMTINGSLKRAFLIVTAWGEEAGDELVVNPIHN